MQRKALPGEDFMAFFVLCSPPSKHQQQAFLLLSLALCLLLCYYFSSRGKENKNTEKWTVCLLLLPV